MSFLLSGLPSLLVVVPLLMSYMLMLYLCPSPHRDLPAMRPSRSVFRLYRLKLLDPTEWYLILCPGLSGEDLPSTSELEERGVRAKALDKACKRIR